MRSNKFCYRKYYPLVVEVVSIHINIKYFFDFLTSPKVLGTDVHEKDLGLALSKCGPFYAPINRQTNRPLPHRRVGGQESCHRYLICKPCHCHAIYNLLGELKFHSNQ